MFKFHQLALTRQHTLPIVSENKTNRQVISDSSRNTSCALSKSQSQSNGFGIQC